MDTERSPSRSSRNFRKFRSDLLVEIVLVAVLVGYFLAAESQSVGENLSFTVIGASLMALVTCWTLNTVRDALELVAGGKNRRRRAA